MSCCVLPWGGALVSLCCAHQNTRTIASECVHATNRCRNCQVAKRHVEWAHYDLNLFASCSVPRLCYQWIIGITADSQPVASGSLMAR